MVTKREFISSLTKNNPFSPRRIPMSNMMDSKKLGGAAIKGMTQGVDAARKVGLGIDKMISKPDPRGIRASNLFTGKKNRGWVAPALIATGVGLGMASGRSSDRVWSGGDAQELTFSEAMGRRPKPGSSASMEAPMMLADATQNPRLAHQADDLGTSGDMVLGMHNSKQGGYL